MSLTIDFALLGTNAAAALKGVVSALAAEQLQPIDVSSDGRVRRTAGVSYREAVLTFADSQKLTLRVKQTGDIYQVALNGKTVPVAAQDDVKSAAHELAMLVDGNRVKFQKRLALLKMPPPEGVKTAAPRQRELLQQQVAELDKQIAEATDELASLQAETAPA